jgi:N-acetylglutamate synthase-like GNAT family acetyltransferase
VVSPLPADLWAAARRDLLALFGYVENADVRLKGNALLGLSGGPTADFNMALIDDDGNALSEFADRVTKAGLPTTFMLSSACAKRLGPIAKEKGLVKVGNAPLMALGVGQMSSPLAGEVARSAGGEPQARHGFAIEHVTNEKSLGAVADLVSAAFELDRAWVGRTFCSNTLLESPTLSFFLASKEGEPCSAVTTTAGRTTVGIWSMATSPNHLRQGAGRAVLLAAMEHHRTLGATMFYLIATPSGKPLYDSIGFTSVDEFPIWVAAGSG